DEHVPRSRTRRAGSYLERRRPGSLDRGPDARTRSLGIPLEPGPRVGRDLRREGRDLARLHGRVLGLLHERRSAVAHRDLGGLGADGAGLVPEHGPVANAVGLVASDEPELRGRGTLDLGPLLRAGLALLPAHL